MAIRSTVCRKTKWQLEIPKSVNYFILPFISAKPALILCSEFKKYIWILHNQNQFVWIFLFFLDLLAYCTLPYCHAPFVVGNSRAIVVGHKFKKSTTFFMYQPTWPCCECALEHTSIYFNKHVVNHFWCWS